MKTNKEFHELSEDELTQVSGGAGESYTGPVFSHVIKKGDCLSVIAQRYGTTVNVLMSLNPNIKNPDILPAPGNTIIVPVSL